MLNVVLPLSVYEWYGNFTLYIYIYLDFLFYKKKKKIVSDYITLNITLIRFIVIYHDLY